MAITLEKAGGIQIVAIEGRMDFTSSAELRSAVEAVVAAGERKLVFDLRDLQYISSSGLSVFVQAAKLVQPDGGKIVFCAMRSHVRNVFDMVGFFGIFDAYATREEALQSLGAI